MRSQGPVTPTGSAPVSFAAGISAPFYQPSASFDLSGIFVYENEGNQLENC